MSATPALPAHADTIVVGGGTAGAAVAGLLAERRQGSILLLEAGPDYGPLHSGRWPFDLTNASAIGTSCDWGFHSGDLLPNRRLTFERARVIGGCSAHNGCAAIWGHRLDYDGWATDNPGWSTDELKPLFTEAARRLRVRTYQPHEVTPFQQACLDALVATGLPQVDDLNDLDGGIGVAPSPVNNAEGIRWNASFAYLDPVREGHELTIIGDALVDRLIIEKLQVTSVEVTHDNQRHRITADRVVLAGGVYGSPAVLMRSGIGDPADLESVGITPIHPLPGVGQNLHDHPTVVHRYQGTPELIAQMTEFAAREWMPEEQVIAKACTSTCREAFDLHLYPVGGPDPADRTQWWWVLHGAYLTPRSRGHLKLTSADPEAPLTIDHRYLSDPDGADIAALVDANNLMRAWAAQSPLSDLLSEEIAHITPGPTSGDLANWVQSNVVHYYHPVGTCAMGPATNPQAVVDHRGQVHGLTGLTIADCSIMPTIPRANTNLPALVVGHHIANLHTLA